MTIRDYEMSGEQKRQYKSMEEEFLLEIENETITVDVAIAKYAKLAQIQPALSTMKKAMRTSWLILPKTRALTSCSTF